MAKYAELAKAVLDAVGGEENITFATHCVTRLRFNLKDESLADDEAVEKIKGVVGVKHAAGQYQVIVGTMVPDVYKELMKLIGDDKGEAGEPEEKKTPLSMLMKLISGIMMPVLPPLIACGFVSAINTTLTYLGVISVDSSIYTLLYGIGQTCLYFFPVLIGASAAKFFGIDLFVGAVIGASMIYPTFVEAASTGQVFDIFGLHLTMGSYASTVFPAILAVAFASVIYKFVKNHLPEAISYALTPAITVLVTTPLAVFLIGPAANAVSAVLTQGILAIYNFSPILCGVVLTPLCGLVMIPFGIHWALIACAINNVATLGSDPLLGLACTSMSFVGICLGYALRSKDPDRKSLGFSAALTAIFGISEPSLYGVILPNKKVIIATIVSGFIPSIIPAVFGTHVYSMAASGIFMFPCYIGPDGDLTGFIGAVIANVLGFLLGLIATYVLYRDPDDEAETAQAKLDAAH